MGGDDDDSSDEEDFEKMMATNILTDETDELRNLPENDFRAAFAQQYKMEVERQIKLLGLMSLDDLMPSLEDDEDDEGDDVLTIRSSGLGVLQGDWLPWWQREGDFEASTRSS